MGGWLLKAGLLEGEWGALAVNVSRSFTMKQLWINAAVQKRLKALVLPEKRRQFDVELRKYVLRFLTRRPSQLRLPGVGQREDGQRGRGHGGNGVGAGSGGGNGTVPALSFIIQYWRHPSILHLLISRLQHPAVEVVVHADSNTTADQAAFEHVRASFSNVRIVHSPNIHEVRQPRKPRAPDALLTLGTM